MCIYSLWEKGKRENFWLTCCTFQFQDFFFTTWSPAQWFIIMWNEFILRLVALPRWSASVHQQPLCISETEGCYKASQLHPSLLANTGDPRWLEDSQRNTHLQEGPEGGSQELQACQHDVCAGEDYTVVHLKYAYWACEGQPGDQAQPAWIQDREVLFDQPDLLLWPGDLPSGRGKGCQWCPPGL